MWDHLCARAYLRESLALTLHSVFGWQGHTGPGRRAVEHDAAVAFTNFTTESEHNIIFTLVDYLEIRPSALHPLCTDSLQIP